MTFHGQVQDKLQLIANEIDLHYGSAIATVQEHMGDTYFLEFPNHPGSREDIREWAEVLNKSGLTEGPLREESFTTHKNSLIEIYDNLRMSLDGRKYILMTFTLPRVSGKSAAVREKDILEKLDHAITELGGKIEAPPPPPKRTNISKKTLSLNNVKNLRETILEIIEPDVKPHIRKLHPPLIVYEKTKEDVPGLTIAFKSEPTAETLERLNGIFNGRITYANNVMRISGNISELAEDIRKKAPRRSVQTR